VALLLQLRPSLKATLAHPLEIETASQHYHHFADLGADGEKVRLSE